MRLYLVRHGENPANVYHILSCRKADFRLTFRGRRQAHALGEQLRPHLPGDTAWWSSLLRRARHTAELLAPPATTVRPLENLRELDAGFLDGSGRTDHRRAYEAVITAWRAGDDTARFPGGESLAEATARLADALRVVAGFDPGGSAVVVGHGGLFTEGLRALLSVDDRERFKDCHQPRWLNCEAAELTAGVAPDGHLELSWGAWHSPWLARRHNGLGHTIPDPKGESLAR
ncbi:histidine phosphatase family protein [Nocardiopsis rhodophaea]|uniref:histidine phosphatase family protein n=1 Tax=Nocardiopsis rhodophaea TaxID=280238 RepID=UPI0031D3FAE6